MKLRNVSASQTTTFERCQRLWWFERIAGFRSPKSPAMQLGTDIHDAIEHYLLYGWIRDDEFKKFVIALQPHLPTPDVNCFVELKIQLPTIDDLPWLGFIDLTEYESTPMRVLDYKTTSDFRYAKTPHELSTNTQLISYAEWCYQEGYEGEIELGHLYVHTRRVTPTIKPVYVTVDREHVRAEWDKRLKVVEKMIEVAGYTDALSVKPTVTACGMYGGCSQRARCGVIAPSPLKQLGTPRGKGKASMSFLSNLRKKQAEKAANNGQSQPVVGVVVPAPGTPAEPTPVPTGVLSPDAPPRTTTPEEAAEIQEAAKKRGRKKMTLAEKALKKVERDREKLQKAEEEALALAAEEGLDVPAPAVMGAVPGGVPSPRDRPGHPDYKPPVTTAVMPVHVPHDHPLPIPETIPTEAIVKDPPLKIALNVEGLLLYVDCIPTRNTEYTLFEDWFKSLADKIADEAELPDYRLLPYAEEKAAVAIAISAQHEAKSLPVIMVVNSKSLGARDALSALIPLASEIVRAVH